MKNIQIKVTVEVSHKTKGSYGDNTVELIRNTREHTLPVGTIAEVKSEVADIINSVAMAARDTLNRTPNIEETQQS